MASWIESPFKTMPELPDGVYTTPRRMLKMGICLCDRCGKVASIDYKYCKGCDEEIFIVVTKK